MAEKLTHQIRNERNGVSKGAPFGTRNVLKALLFTVILASSPTVQAKTREPGVVSNITISPSNMGIRELATYKISFVPTHAFSDNGKIRIRMPEGLLLPPINQKI